MFSGQKKLRVVLKELKKEPEVLSGFLRKFVKGSVTSSGHDVLVDSGEVSPEELKGMVNKFIYHHHLNNTYWVALDDNSVIIHKFKEKKAKKRKKPANPPATIKHGWL